MSMLCGRSARASVIWHVPLLQDWKERMLFPPPLATGWFWSPPPPRLAMRLPGRVPP